ncbi:MAG: hypothetical protein WHX52_03885 [Anaerolineae bacterium]
MPEMDQTDKAPISGAKRDLPQLPLRFKQWWSVGTVLLLVAMGVVSQATFAAPVIYSDDWSSFIKPMVDGNIPWVDWTSRRPLELALRRLLFDLFGVNLPVAYIVLGLLIVLAAIQFYFLVLRFFPSKPLIASVAAGIMLIAPVDYTRTWLTMIHIRLAMCLFLLYASLLHDYIESGRTLSLLGAWLAFGLSLGMYEAQLGLALAWCVGLVVLYREIGWGRRFAVLSPIGLGLVFMVWRTFGITQAGIADHYLGEMQLSPGILVNRLVLGFKVLVWGWTEPLRQIFGFNGNWLPMGMILLSMGLAGGVAMLLDRRAYVGARSFYGWRQAAEWREVGGLFAAGIVGTVAGYIPIGLLYEPNLDSLASRVNLFALTGASLLVVALLYGAALLVARTRQQVLRLVLAGALPLMSIGIATQVLVQYDIRVAWIEQKHIWSQLFTLIPNLADDTTVCFVLNGNQDRVGFVNWKRLPLSSNWELTGALQVLYGNDTLRGEVLFSDVDVHDEARLTEEGVIDFWTGFVTPYDRVVFVFYEEESRRLRVLDDLSFVFAGLPTPSTYDPHARILDSPTLKVQWRWLVAASSVTRDGN